MAALTAAKKGLKGMLKVDMMETKMVEKRDERTVARKDASLAVRMAA